jgi:hypothetical protein
VLAALSERNRYRSLVGAVPTSMMTAETSVMLQWYNLYFSTFPERKHIVHDELESLVRLRSTGSSAESLALTLHLVNQLRTPVPDGSIDGIVGQLSELDLSGRVGAVLARYNNGEEVDLAYELKTMSSDTLRSIGQSQPETYCDTPIDDLLKEVSNDTGIKFRRISVLRESIAGLQGGASIAIGARPDKGKTSLLADVLTDWAPQCVQFFGVHRPILWLCNEGSSKRVVPRIYQAALAKDLNEIVSLSNAGQLVAAYEAAIGAPHNYIRVKDAHGMSLHQIEQVIEAMNPCVVVYDMMGNVKLGKSNGGGNKADEVEQLWQAGREMAVVHDHIMLGTIQISAPGDNLLYPPYTFLKDSQTAVQGATDIILQLGSLNNPDAQTLRGISTPKNKFAMPGKQSYVMSELYFDGPKCRFSDGSTA